MKGGYPLTWYPLTGYHLTGYHLIRNWQSILAALVVLVCAGGVAGGAGGLWGGENLIGDPQIEAGDIVTIVIAPAREPRPSGMADSAGASPSRATASLSHSTQTAARVVKRLPNGNLVLEARVRLGSGYVLIGGETARKDLRANRTVDISRLANLAVVARGLDGRVLADFMKALARSGPDGTRRRFASGGPVGKE